MRVIHSGTYFIYYNSNVILHLLGVNASHPWLLIDQKLELITREDHQLPHPEQGRKQIFFHYWGHSSFRECRVVGGEPRLTFILVASRLYVLLSGLVLIPISTLAS